MLCATWSAHRHFTHLTVPTFEQCHLSSCCCYLLCFPVRHFYSWLTNYLLTFSLSFNLFLSLSYVLSSDRTTLFTFSNFTIFIIHISLFLPPPSPLISQVSKIDSLRSKVDLLRLPLTLSCKSISNHKSQLGVVWEKGLGAGGARKPRPPTASDMDNESMYSAYSYKSSQSRTSRKHRYHRSCSTAVHYHLM